MIKLLKIGFEDVQRKFGIEEDLFCKYIEKEVFQDEDLKKIISIRDSSDFDWTKNTPHGGAGTTLNALALYALIRHFKIKEVIETGVSGGYYSSFMLAALSKNNDAGSPMLTSLEISNDTKEIGKLVPNKFLSLWNLKMGAASVDVFREWKTKGAVHAAGLYSHGSLHTLENMMKELMEFKESKSSRFFVFIDDEKSDNFWAKCIQMNMFKKIGYKVDYISGAESRLNGHLGGFVRFEKQ